jgi:hypothetical protein
MNLKPGGYTESEDSLAVALMQSAIGALVFAANAATR